MPTVYRRGFNLKDSLNDAEVEDFWRFMMEEAAPVVQNVKGIHGIRYYSGAGALRADCSIVIEMEDAGVYERLLLDPDIRKLLGRLYGAIDLKTTTQSFRRQVTPSLVRALTGP